MDTAVRLEVQKLAEGLSKEEVLDYLGLKYDELEEEDQKDFDQAYKRGMIELKRHAVLKLKEAMSGKEALSASLAVLTRFADEWEESAEEAAKKTRSFRVILDE